MINDVKVINHYHAKLINFNFHSLAVVSRYRDPQFQVAENYPWLLLKWWRTLAPVAETGFSHRLTAYKIERHFSGLSYLNISGTIQIENIFFKSVTFQFHARMLSSEIALSHRHVDFFRVKQIYQFTASERTTRLDSREMRLLSTRNI